MLLIRNVMRMARDLVRFSIDSGRWWVPVVMLLLGLGGILLIAAKALVPSSMYVLF